METDILWKKCLNGIMRYVDSPDAVSSGVVASDFTLAVLPMGSGNDWIKSTGVPKNPGKAVSMLASSSFVRQDVVKVSLLDTDGSVKSTSYMANIGGVGIDADVCRVVNVHKKLGYRGKILYVIALLRCLRKRLPVNVRVLSDGATLYDGNIFSIAFGIGKYSGGGMRQTSDAVLDDGLLDVTVIPDIPLGIMTVVTGVAGSGKSSLIRDVFAKQYEEQVVLIDQSAVTATGRSTVCTFLGFFDEIRKVFAKENGVQSKNGLSV